MNNEDVHESQKKRESTGSASERAFQLLLEKAQSLAGFGSGAAGGLNALFEEDREVIGDEILNVVFPEEKEEEGQADAADQEN